MNAQFLYSDRFLFVAASPSLLDIELASFAQFGQLLNVAIPGDWPPGEYDRDAMEFFRDQLRRSGGTLVGWFSWYVIAYPTATTPATLVAGAGFFGPPDAEASVEIGYSVSEEWRRKGVATELVATLIKHVATQGVRRVVAHTALTNEASVAVLMKNGFRQTEPDQPEKRRFELLLA